VQGGWCADFLLALRRCRPVERVRLKYCFCKDCRESYRGYDTSTVGAVLNYWAYKNARGYSFSVAASMVPAQMVFGRLAPNFADPKLPRCELIALDKALPRIPFEAPAKWLLRLEEARAVTLELAEALSCKMARRRASGITGSGDVVRLQPRITRPRSIYPYALVLGAETEESEPQKIVAELRPRQHDTAASPQVHLETLQRLCGEIPPDFLGENGPEPQVMAVASDVSAPVGHEHVRDQHQTAFMDDVTAIPRPLMIHRSSEPQYYQQSNPPQNVAVEMEHTPETEVNMTSHFSVSDIDPDDAVSSPTSLLARVG
jgi:hypothetical protein